MKYLLPILIIIVSIVGLQANGFSPLQQWKKEFPGVWSAKIGDPSEEQSWTALAAEKPRVNALNNLSSKEFPFSSIPIEYIETDGRIGVSIPSSINSKIYGLGLHLEGAKRVQDTYELKAQLNQGSSPVPFFILNDQVGIFFDTARYINLRTHLSVKKDAKAKPIPLDKDPVEESSDESPKWTDLPLASTVDAELHAKGLRIFVITGDNILDIVSRYNLLNGGGTLPPLWGLGIYQQMPSDFNSEQIIGTVAEYEKHNTPLDMVGLSSGWMSSSYPCTYEWRKERFPSPSDFIQKLGEKQIRINLWENPYIAPKAKLYGSMYELSGSHLVWNGIVPDLYFPETVSLLTDHHLSSHINAGISAYQVDNVAGPDKWFWPDHAIFPSGISAESMRQTLSTVYQKTYYDQIFKRRNLRTYGLTNSMGGSSSGYPTVIRNSEGSQQISAISSASMSGLLWSPELQSSNNSKEWLRNAEFAAFSPLTIVNAVDENKSLWSYEGQKIKGINQAFHLRLRLLPYLYSAFADYYRKGIPPFRSMVLEDFETADLSESQYMMGANILVAPYEDTNKSRKVFFPAGKWYDFYSGKIVVEDGGEYTAESKKIPLFVKDGAMIPMLAKNIKNTNEAYGESLEIRVYGEPKLDQGLWIYEDDGKTFNYQKGKSRYRIIKLHKDGEPSVEIQGDGPVLYGEQISVRLMSE